MILGVFPVICRRCNKEIPDASLKCPRCGVSQGRHMSRGQTPIAPKPRTWFTNPKALLSLGGVIVLIIISINFSRDYQRNVQFQAIEAVYAKSDADLLEEMGSMYIPRAELLETMGTRFITRHPNDGRHDRILEMIKSATDFVTEDDFDRLIREFLDQQRRDHDEHFDYLRANARTAIFSVADLQPTGRSADGRYGFSVTWYNRSDKTIEEIIFYVEGFDGGQTVPTVSGQERVRGTVAAHRPPGYRTVSQWLNAWIEPVTYFVLHGVHIRYVDGTNITLPAEVLETVWG
jgi:hypothetical protein